jgi:hypothetical protein
VTPTATHTLALPRQPVDAERLSWLRFGNLGGGVLLTNDQGRWHHVTPDAFRAFLAGSLPEGDATLEALAAKGFVRDRVSLDEAAQTVRARKRFVGVGPTVHLIHLAGSEGALAVDTAKDVLDHVMLSTAHALELRLLAPGAIDADLISFLLQYGTEKNRYEGKGLTWRLFADPSALTPAVESLLHDKRVQLVVRLDGPAELHDAQRDATATVPSADHATTRAALARLAAAGSARSRAESKPAAEVFIGAANVGHPEDVLAELIDAGVRRFRLHPIFAGPHAVSPGDFQTFYARFLDGLVRAMRDGEPLVEDHTHTLLTRALRTEHGPDVETRAPCGQGMGMLVYDASGRIFPSEAARRLADDGDELFLLGTAGVVSYKDCMAHPTLRTLALSSIVECLPGFSDHWSAPFCGVDPTAAYAATGDLFPRLHETPEVRAEQGMLEALFLTLISASTETLAAFQRYTATA